MVMRVFVITVKLLTIKPHEVLEIEEQLKRGS